MANLSNDQFNKGKKTMSISILLSLPGAIVTVIPAITSRSATQIADFIRRTAELIAMIISWWVYRNLQRYTEKDDIYRARLESIADSAVAWAMICSGTAMLIVGLARLFVFKSSGNVILGLVIAVLGLLTNSWFWWRYRSLIKLQFDSVIEGQQKLYRAKASVDLCVVIALTSVAVAPNHPATKYIDALGCILVAGYLLHNGISMLQKNKTLEHPKGKDL